MALIKLGRVQIELRKVREPQVNGRVEEIIDEFFLSHVQEAHLAKSPDCRNCKSSKFNSSYGFANASTCISWYSVFCET